MRGKVLSVDATAGGSIVGEDGARYRFTRDSAAGEAAFAEDDLVEFSAGWHHQVQPGSLRRQPLPESAPGVPQRSLDIGRTLQRTFGSIGQNGGLFSIAAGVLFGVPGVIGALGLAGGAGLAGLGLSAVLYLIGGYVLQAIVVQACVSDSSGVRMGLVQALETSARALPTLIGASVVVAIATGLGYVLLVVPGVMLSVIWIVVAPVIVIERLSIGASLQRSRDLTRGSRGQIFALLLLYGAASLAIGLFETGLRTAIIAGADSLSTSLVAVAVGAVVNAMTGLVAAAGVAAIYFELRETKEGVAVEQLAAIFD